MLGSIKYGDFVKCTKNKCEVIQQTLKILLVALERLDWYSFWYILIKQNNLIQNFHTQIYPFGHTHIWPDQSVLAQATCFGLW